MGGGQAPGGVLEGGERLRLWRAVETGDSGRNCNRWTALRQRHAPWTRRAGAPPFELFGLQHVFHASHGEKGGGQARMR